MGRPSGGNLRVWVAFQVTRAMSFGNLPTVALRLLLGAIERGEQRRRRLLRFLGPDR